MIFIKKSMYFFSHPSFFRKLAPSHVVWQVPSVEKKIYLTFDDGPTPGVTPKLLSMLAHYGATATFFCTGQQVQKYSGLYESILAHGHTTGNHTYSHIDAWRCLPQTFMNDVQHADALIQSRLFRPPYGHLPLQTNTLHKLGFKIILWSLMSYDFDPHITPDRIVKQFSYTTQPGSIWVFHDNVKSSNTCLNTVPLLLERFMREGYRFEGL
jgi:peptidoglycan-N-acetylglucosamine deacetylase